MNPAYFPQPDRGVDSRAGWAMPETGFAENVEAQWDVAQTPDHFSIYDERAALFYDDAIAKAREYGLGDFPNPYRMTNEFGLALSTGEGHPDMVKAVRVAGPESYRLGEVFDPFPLRDAWRTELDRILIKARDAHPDIPDPNTFDAEIARESAETRARADDIASRATFVGHVGGFVGGTGGTMARPEEMTMTVLTLPVGGVVTSLARTVVGRILVAAATDAVLGAAQTGAGELAEARFQQQHFGYSKSGNEILLDMAYAAAGNALFGAAAQGIGEAGAYALARWKGSSGGSGSDLGRADDGVPTGPAPDPNLGPTGGAPIAFGLRAAAEQAQDLYSVLPKIGRDGADVLGSELQVATTGPAGNLTAHAENVAQAADAVTQGVVPTSIQIPEGPYSAIAFAPDGRLIKTKLEVVEFDELRPGSPIEILIKETNDLSIAFLKSLPDEELARFKMEGTTTADGKLIVGGKTIESFMGDRVHVALAEYSRRKQNWSTDWLETDAGGTLRPDTWNKKYPLLVDWKPKSSSGRLAGKSQAMDYDNELGMKALIREWGITSEQSRAIVEIKQKIASLHEQPQYRLVAKPAKTKRKRRARVRSKQRPKQN